jgi:hypothetical protein
LKGKYIPPAARLQQQQEQQQQKQQAQSTSFLYLSHAPSSDSEGASDTENVLGGSITDIKLSRVRFLALACLQLLIKSDPKAMHPLWPSLLPGSDTDLVGSSTSCISSIVRILVSVQIMIYD